MLSLFNPWVLLVLICAFLGVGAVSYTKGQDNEHDRQQIEMAALNAKARETEQAMAQVAQTYGQTLKKANDAAKVKEAKLRNDIVSSKLKLFVPIQVPECAVSATEDTPASAGDTETRAELDPRIAESLVDLASRGDQAIRSLNACIDQYNEIRNMK
jgi:transglutaminase/protease-like cytokinesis protein 3